MPEEKRKRGGLNRRIIPAGTRFANAVVVRQAPPKTLSSGRIKMMVWCLCDCGTLFVAKEESLKTGNTKSCGCRHVKHMMTHTREYETWRGIRRRCYDVSLESYPRYGGRGIKVCEAWLESFGTFYRDMGPKPKGTSIGRKDNDGHYEPDNCRWETPTQQNRNRNSCWVLTVNGITGCVADLAEQFNIPYQRVHRRLRKGVDVVKAFTEPLRYTQG